MACWNIQWLKTTKEPEQRVKYQGFITDTVLMQYHLDEHKQTDVLHAIDSLLRAGQKLIPTRDLAAAVRKIAAIRLSHSNIVNVMTRSSQHQLGQVVGCDGNWDSAVVLNNHSIDELTFLCQNLTTFNGTFIPVHKSADEVYELARNRETIKLISETDLPINNLVISDASDTNAFVFSASEISLVRDFEFSESERSLSSGQCELRAVLLTLMTDKEKLHSTNKRIIYWQTDSHNCYSFLNKGSKLRHIHTPDTPEHSFSRPWVQVQP